MKCNSKCIWYAQRNALYIQCLIVISALTGALHVHKGVTFRLSLTVVVNIQNDNNVNAIQQQKRLFS